LQLSPQVLLVSALVAAVPVKRLLLLFVLFQISAL